MGIDYSSGMGYGFKVDLELLEAWFNDNRELEEEGYERWEAIEAFCSEFEGLGYTYGSPYDSEEEFGVVIDSSFVDNYDHRSGGAFGVFPLGEMKHDINDQITLSQAYDYIGTGPIGPIVSFNCS